MAEADMPQDKFSAIVAHESTQKPAVPFCMK